MVAHDTLAANCNGLPDLLLDLTPSSRHEPALSHAQIIERILTISPAADTQYLSRFRPDKLSDYLDHLVSAQEPRGRNARWIRRGDTPAIVMHEAPE